MAIGTYGMNAVDWEERIDLDRLRHQRLARLKDTLERSNLGAVLAFDFPNIRYMTATHIGTWAIDKFIRFALLCVGGAEPIVWDFGSAARHHQLYNPWLDGTKRARAGISVLRGAFHPDAGIAEELARKIATELSERGLLGAPVGVDIAEMPVLLALQQGRHRGGRRTAALPRGPTDQEPRTRSHCLPRHAPWWTPPTRSCTGSCARA